MDLTYETAIARTKLPAPTEWLLKHHHLSRDEYLLDFGSGRSAKVNDEHFDHCDNYDPYYGPHKHIESLPQSGYDVILCNYVLCVVDTIKKRQAILNQINSLLRDSGNAYISVRRQKAGKIHDGRISQFHVRLNAKILHYTTSYILYILDKDDTWPALLL